MSGKPSLVQLDRLCKQFGSHRVLQDVKAEVDAGQCIILRGGNGQGKTTLLRCMAGLARPTSGYVRWFGRSLGADRHHSAHLGMVAHECRLYPQLSLLENLLFAARMYRVPHPLQRCEQLLDEVGLRACAERRPGEVSRGMRQKVAVVRALVHQPSVLLLDEPFAGLDDSAGRWLRQRLQLLLESGCCICLTTHDPALVRPLASRVWELRHGQLHEVSLPQGFEPRPNSSHTTAA